ncbi:MAG: transketolase [Treponema sp.]|jgi:transketolase|nr:transketolase [Treponema sp.]
MLSALQIKETEAFAKEIRKKTIYTIGHLGVGHIGGSLSIVEVLSVLYNLEMNYDEKNPTWEDRDMLVLSKGHSGPALYSTLALKGFFPITWLDTLNQGGTKLPSHCDRKRTPGIDMSTGSLGQGLSAACGMALGRRIDKKNCYVYAIIGDGESDEGQNWEAGMFAAQYKLAHLIAFTDFNKLQLDGPVDEIMNLEPLQDKWKSFGWFTQRVDGHDIAAIYTAIEKAKQQKEKPSMIILDTVKGKGASFAEGLVSNHNMTFDMATAEKAIAELD